MTPEERKAYLAGIAKERGFDEARVGKLISLVEGDGDVTISRADLQTVLAPIIEHPLARHAEFSSAMDGVKTKYAALEKWRNETAEPTVKKAEADLAAAHRRIQAFTAKYGELDDVEDIGGGRGVTTTGNIVDMTKVNEMLEARTKQSNQEFIAFQIDQDRITRAHFDRFKTLPDVSSLIQIIGAAANDPINPRRLSLDDAYNEKYKTEVDKYNADADNRRIDTEVQKRLAAERARKGAPATGTNADGVFWAHHKDIPAAPVQGQQTVNESDLAAAFRSDFETSLQQEVSATTSQ